MSSLKNVIKAALDKSISYIEYRELVALLAERNSCSGPLKSEGQIAFTRLNDRRMKRWDKTLKVSNEVRKKLEDITEPMTWIVITESWCGDAAHIVLEAVGQPTG